MKPSSSLECFLEKLIDYAGLFPPAKLEIEPAINNYLEIIKSRDRWIISQFIIPISRLNEISTDLMKNYSKEFPLTLSLISTDLCNEIIIVNDFLNKYGSSSKFIGNESSILDLSTFSQYLLNVHQICKKQNLHIVSFYEVGPSDNWIEEMNEAVSKISRFNAEYGENIGFKLRCGGVEAHMFPPAEDIAYAILACIQAGISMKFTAGLHHPIRHYNESVKTKMYGFFNIFIAGMIAHKFNVGIDILIHILLEEIPENFKFDENGLSWKDYSISNIEIQKYRRDFFISYGSCSFDEPLEDLQQLGLL